MRVADVASSADFVIPTYLLADAQRYLAAARATNTRAARRSDWKVFSEWCAAHEYTALPARADTVFTYMIEQARVKKPATLIRYLTSISVAHGGAGHPDPTKDPRVVELMGGVRRELGMRQRQAAPMTREVLVAVRPHCNARDWAVVCFGQALAARRSELVALDLDDVVIDARGTAVTFRRSKTDQEGRGAVVGVPRRPADPLCPVMALTAYLAQDTPPRLVGPLFTGVRTARLTSMEVHRTIKRVVAAAGLDAKLYSGHSLRAGYVTDARRAGQSWTAIMEHTRHRELKTVKSYARYDRDPFAAKVD